METSKVVKIVSGGQTGADRGGLDAAIELGIPHAGWCPKGRRAEDEIIPSKYLLKESGSSYYVKRTEQNVDDSTATVIFYRGRLFGGSKKTEEFAVQYGRPVLSLDLDMGADSAVRTLHEWLMSLHDSLIILNVAGMRGSKAPDIHSVVKDVLVCVLQQMGC